jgi:Uma2 family endonuclease
MTRTQYDALVDTGLLEGEHIELLEGMLVEASPQSAEHVVIVTRLNRWLIPRLPEPWGLRVQAPLAATDRSEPQPDLAVAQETVGHHPSTAALAIEVAVSSHRTDLLVKPRIYTAAAVTEYWVIDVSAREVVVHSEPGPSGYALVRRLPWTAPVSVPVAAGIPVDLATVLARPQR